MKRMILCLATVLAAGSVFAAETQSSATAVDRQLLAQPAANCNTHATETPEILVPGATGQQAQAMIACSDCDILFGDCMSDCWEAGAGPECKNQCVGYRQNCQANCE
jgi:hypothetical protein